MLQKTLQGNLWIICILHIGYLGDFGQGGAEYGDKNKTSNGN